MSLSVIAEFWSAMKPFLATSDRPEAADTLVNILIDHDFDPREIKRKFNKIHCSSDQDSKARISTYRMIDQI